MPDLFERARGTACTWSRGGGARADLPSAPPAPSSKPSSGSSRVAPFRHMLTPGGCLMSVAMTNCGAAGWITDRRGYRYDAIDPEADVPWPAMPEVFADLAHAGGGGGRLRGLRCRCLPDKPLRAGCALSLHQDRNERDLSAPVVSVSLGLPAIFLFGGSKRTDRPQRVTLGHGDVVVWGGPARMAFHGVLPLADGEHPMVGRRRLNLTLRRAL